MGLADEAVAGVTRDVQLVLEHGQPVTRAQLLKLEAVLDNQRLTRKAQRLGYPVPESTWLPLWLEPALDAELARRAEAQL